MSQITYGFFGDDRFSSASRSCSSVFAVFRLIKRNLVLMGKKNAHEFFVIQNTIFVL